MFCTSCGTQAVEGSAFCQRCGKPLAAAAAPATPAVNPPGAGNPPSDLPPPLPRLDKPAPAPAQVPPPAQPYPMAQPAIPDGVAGWSWGAFLLSWIWAIGNRTWIGLLALVPYVGFGVAIWLGIKGREMAWKNGHWQSLEHFNRVQKSWSRWGVGLIVGMLGLSILAAVAIPSYVAYKNRAREAAAEVSLEDAIAASAEPAAPEAPVAAAATPAPAAEVSDSGNIDSNADSLPTALATSAGPLVRSGEFDERRVTLNGKALFNGNDAPWQFPVRSFTLSQGREAILMASSGGRGNSCETLFFFLLIDGSDVKTTPEFGTCAPQGRYTQHGDRIALELPKMGGMSTAELKDGNVFEDGKLLALDASNDPSQ